MRSDETWDGHFNQTPTKAELLARDQWFLIQLDNAGAPSVCVIVSFLRFLEKLFYLYDFSRVARKLVK